MLCLPLLATGCQQNEAPDFSYYEERIAPTLTSGCARSPSGGGCHLAREDGTALGNLDLTSYDTLMRRDDLLDAYGPYSTSLLLLKAGGNIDVQVETFDPDNRFVSVTTDIRHANGVTISPGSSGYSQLKQWTEAGYTRTGVQDESLTANIGTCVTEPGAHPWYDPGVADRFPEAFARFRSDVQPILRRSCAGSSCHGSGIADLYLTCGENDAQARWNFWISLSHLTEPASTSGFLRRPLSSFRGGVYHEGGNAFASAEDPDYVVLREWAELVVSTYPEAIDPPDAISEGLRYFANRVQPVLVRKGCMFLNCHSTSMFHDLRLQGGSQGHFSRVAFYRNYESSRLLLAPDASNPNESRIIAKNLFPPELVPGMPGLFHRGGPLFEDFSADGMVNGATPDDCVGFDADNGDLNEVPAYCIFIRWHQIEREEAIARGELFADTEIVRSVIWVSRPTGVGEPRDFDTYRPGADLVMAPATVDPTTEDLSLGAEVSLLAGCGLDSATADIRGTAVSHDGARVSFSARSSASEPLRLYWMNSDGSACERVPGVAPAADLSNDIATHDFDPAFAPDGRLVFASARGNLDSSILGIDGATLTPAGLQPNANLFVFDPATSDVRQLTFLLNQEMQPSFMTDGRLISTTEKRSLDFHQLAGRRQNLDGGDYHPLFAQRASVGYESATEIIELLDRNFAIVAAPMNAADGAGRIAIVNRSIGPDQVEPRPTGDGFYIPSQRFPTSTGVFRSPYALPTGRMIVSCDLSTSDPTTGGFDFDLCELDPDTGAVRALGGVSGRADVEAIAVYARFEREIFASRVDEANGHTEVIPGDTIAEVEVVDFPVLATLLFANTRQGRPIDPEIGGFDVMVHRPPASRAAANMGDWHFEQERVGHVGLNPDGSARFRYRGGLPVSLRITDWGGNPISFADGAPFSGEMFQREQMQFYPGERSHQSFRRELFNGMCGGCHGSFTNRELDIAVDVDVLTTASRAMSNDQGAQGIGL